MTPTTPRRPEPLLTAPELADELRVSLWTVRDMTRRRELPVVRVRRSLRYRLNDVLGRLEATR